MDTPVLGPQVNLSLQPGRLAHNDSGTQSRGCTWALAVVGRTSHSEQWQGSVTTPNTNRQNNYKVVFDQHWFSFLLLLIEFLTISSITMYGPPLGRGLSCMFRSGQKQAAGSRPKKCSASTAEVPPEPLLWFAEQSIAEAWTMEKTESASTSSITTRTFSKLEPWMIVNKLDRFASMMLKVCK